MTDSEAGTQSMSYIWMYIVHLMSDYVVDLMCPCGKPQCYVCNATSEAACVSIQQLQICPNVEV